MLFQIGQQDGFDDLYSAIALGEASMALVNVTVNKNLLQASTR